MNSIAKDDERYPRLLKEIADPPERLFVLGELPPGTRFCCAVVGSRKASPYGREITQTIVRSLAKAGLVIVSGLAQGIDETAHWAAMDAGGLTVAVIASGLDQLSSSRQRDLAKKIVASGGAVISENPLGTPPEPWRFPVRNRLISGFSQATLVVEAAESSGSLITARHALEQGRELFAVPGPITWPTSAGTNNLIKTGAHVVTSTSDVLDVLGLSWTEDDQSISRTQPIQPDNEEESSLLTLLSKRPVHLDELVRQTRQPAAAVSSTLLLMEMKGMVRHVGGNHFIIQ